MLGPTKHKISPRGILGHYYKWVQNSFLSSLTDPHSISGREEKGLLLFSQTKIKVWRQSREWTICPIWVPRWAYSPWPFVNSQPTYLEPGSKTGPAHQITDPKTYFFPRSPFSSSLGHLKNKESRGALWGVPRIYLNFLSIISIQPKNRKKKGSKLPEITFP